MFSTKSSMMMAFLALFLCLSSTVQADTLFNPGNPLNCTLWTQNCMNLGNSIYGNGKNASYTSTSATCVNQTTLTAAQDFCNYKVTCLATFMILGGGPTNAMVNAAAPSAAASSSAAAPAPSAAPSSSAASTATSPAGPKPTGPVFGVASVDLTSQLLALYDPSKCGKGSAAAAKLVTSAGAAAIVASILSIMSYAL